MKSFNNINEKKDYKLSVWLWLFIAIATIWAISFIIIYLTFNNWLSRSSFGDSFGAINALFSGFAFAGIICTIYLQKKELILQRLELEETRKELKRSADAQEKTELALNEQLKTLKLSAKLNALSAMIHHYNTEQDMAVRKGLNNDSYYSNLKEEKVSEIFGILGQLT